MNIYFTAYNADFVDVTVDREFVEATGWSQSSEKISIFSIILIYDKSTYRFLVNSL